MLLDRACCDHAVRHFLDGIERPEASGALRAELYATVEHPGQTT